MIKQPHTLENYRNRQESGNKETTGDKRTGRKSRSMLRAIPLFLFVLRFHRATDDDGASFDRSIGGLAFLRWTFRLYSTIVTFVVQIVTIDRTERRLKRAWRRRIIDSSCSAGSVASLTRATMNLNSR